MQVLARESIVIKLVTTLPVIIKYIPSYTYTVSEIICPPTNLIKNDNLKVDKNN